MTRRTFTIVAVVLVVVGAAVRLNNGLRHPVLASYDGFAHFTYVWYLAATRHVPLPTAGWEFFHPPLYYAAMAALWSACAWLEPVARLEVGVTIVALASLVHAAVVWDVVRRRAPDDYRVQIAALAFMLFVPVHLYAAAFLGNEGLAAVLCSLAFWTLLSVLRRPTWGRSLGLGVLLGSALLTKITALALVVGALTTLGLKALAPARTTMSRTPVARVTTEHVVVVLSALVLVSGWYYARNVASYGTPFVMSRRELMLRIVEDSYPQARRSLAEYVLFDPMIFRRPMWPRDGADEATRSPALRDAVWTGLYANTWFDGFGGWVVPRVTESETARRAGQVLLALGVLPTALVLVGIGSALAQLWRRGWDDALVAMLATVVPMLAIFVVGTRAVPIAAAVKATYLMPATAAFGVAFAVGAERMLRACPAAWRGLAAVLALVAVVASIVFSSGLLFDVRTVGADFPMIEANDDNQYGVVAYAGGDRDAARERFTRAAAAGLHLGFENLALLAYEDGRPEEALHLLKRALRLQPAQSFGAASDRALYDRQTRAEYLNLVAVFSHALGRMTRAEHAATLAMRLDPTLPEAPYDRAVATLARAYATPANAEAEAAALTRARADLVRAGRLDPGFAEAGALAAMLEPGCESALIASSRTAPGMRRYPVETGTGAPYAASIGRRRHVTTWPDRLRTARCGV